VQFSIPHLREDASAAETECQRYLRESPARLQAAQGGEQPILIRVDTPPVTARASQRPRPSPRTPMCWRSWRQSSDPPDQDESGRARARRFPAESQPGLRGPARLSRYLACRCPQAAVVPESTCVNAAGSRVKSSLLWRVTLGHFRSCMLWVLHSRIFIHELAYSLTFSRSC
jgi:hypothetical protein